MIFFSFSCFTHFLFRLFALITTAPTFRKIVSSRYQRPQKMNQPSFMFIQFIIRTLVIVRREVVPSIFIYCR
ncbi:hypothetical protein NY2A_b247L [Paramecium bursaria Chlorella virus NY2A]|uniref:Uncharacterized protein b247L n=1 Tax=Paramecium bursaria Chlorella virus NY2A TaxID=46021 RepID=A7IWC2_PBCVN|nr:hypothetical protein NY2A_b247L [Paramecium bursaria Chlorella virus NY2A]ABT14646.1 hypothetical protein NY2A_b247L [Paramecium bursaria Chlorella virus NY2A]